MITWSPESCLREQGVPHEGEVDIKVGILSFN